MLVLFFFLVNIYLWFSYISPCFFFFSVQSNCRRGATVHFSCDEGYELQGSKSITCLRVTDSYVGWSDDRPICRGKAWQALSRRMCNGGRLNMTPVYVSAHSCSAQVCLDVCCLVLLVMLILHFTVLLYAELIFFFFFFSWLAWFWPLTCNIWLLLFSLAVTVILINPFIVLNSFRLVPSRHSYLICKRNLLDRNRTMQSIKSTQHIKPRVCKVQNIR